MSGKAPCCGARGLAIPHHFSELTEPYRREILLYSYRLLGSLHDAEDLTQEAFLRAWAKLDSFEGRSSFRAWLYSIATHLAFDAIDKRQRRPVTQLVASPTAAGETSYWRGAILAGAAARCAAGG